MEYSPENAIPYVGRVDAGTIEAIRRRGVEVVSSGDLVQRFVARWDDHALATHLEASAALYRVKDRAFEAIAARVRRRQTTTEHDVQQLMVGWFAEEGLISDAPPVVASMENAGNPHYMPPAAGSRTISPNELVLLDLWGKRDLPGAVYADITWVGFTGAAVPAEFARGVLGDSRGPGRGNRPGAAGDARARGSARMAGRSGGPRRARKSRLWRTRAAPDRAQPGRRKSTATASTWTITKPTTIGACCRAPASRSSRAYISITLACALKSTFTSARMRRG